MFKITSQEEGRGKITSAKFKTLSSASAYIQERWQGVEYKDGQESFHTDYSSYILHGFTFADIGKLTIPDGPDGWYDREFVFFAL
jgi:hypothetical protein